MHIAARSLTLRPARIRIPLPGVRARRWLLRLTVAAVALAVIVSAAATIYLLALPGVGDAPARVERILAEHHGTAGGLPLPRKLSAAVVDVEDEHFYSNVFVNVLDGAGRAALAALQTSQDPGGSTIAQQLAKQLYGKGGGLGGTLREIGLGVKLALSYSHERILQMYLNAIYYGNDYWGDVAAARGYFGRDPGQLDWGQAAMLAGLPQAPAAYDPLRHYAMARLRQRHVLSQLVANNAITEAQSDAAFSEPLHLR